MRKKSHARIMKKTAKTRKADSEKKKATTEIVPRDRSARTGHRHIIDEGSINGGMVLGYGGEAPAILNSRTLSSALRTLRKRTRYVSLAARRVAHARRAGSSATTSSLECSLALGFAGFTTRSRKSYCSVISKCFKPQSDGRKRGTPGIRSPSPNIAVEITATPQFLTTDPCLADC